MSRRSAIALWVCTALAACLVLLAAVCLVRAWIDSARRNTLRVRTVSALSFLRTALSQYAEEQGELPMNLEDMVKACGLTDYVLRSPVAEDMGKARPHFDYFREATERDRASRHFLVVEKHPYPGEPRRGVSLSLTIETVGQSLAEEEDGRRDMLWLQLARQVAQKAKRR